MALLKNKKVILLLAAVVAAVVDQVAGTNLLPTVLQSLLGS